jgi:hypothetical protein
MTAGGEVDKWLERCRTLADSPLEGIEEASDELVELAEGDLRLMEQARRRLLAEQEQHGATRTTRQMLSLWRRAMERGWWKWDD